MTALECAQLNELWKERVEDFRISGLSGRQWCAQRGLKVNQLHYWKRKLELTDATASETTWVALDATSSPIHQTEETLRVHVGPATITVRPGFNPEFLQRVVQALAPC